MAVQSLRSFPVSYARNSTGEQSSGATDGTEAAAVVDRKAVVPPPIIKSFPQLRFMGSKFRLLPWIHEVVFDLDFDTVLDAFSGSGAVAYLFKAMGKAVATNDFMAFPTTIAKALIENWGGRLTDSEVADLLRYDPKHPRFIERTFDGIFYTKKDLRFLDRVSWNVRTQLREPKQALALAALLRSCVKRQPRGVFTVAGDPDRYKDGRRDLRLSLEEHFVEQVHVYNGAVFTNGRRNRAQCGSAFDVPPEGHDLVYLDPPYVPRADDNCYMKRYHFLEGLACYWEGKKIVDRSRVKKIEKPYTPFSYRHDAVDAFDRLFARYSKSILVLSYSSNGFPDLAVLANLMGRHKREVVVHERPHTYHFGTHSSVARSRVTEFLLVGR
ncbi:MAG: DNA adenine methylase [Myxococcales bacterium]|nr:DNA adenine methylase [Myxococcales bacterium]